MGAQTQRSLHFFAISTEKMPAPLVTAMLARRRQGERRPGELDPKIADAISRAADEVIAGKWPDEFPLSVWQTGSGTQSNMNMNEVLANRASELLGGERGEARKVHPNDHVNRGQSSNDTFPTAMHVAAAVQVEHHLLPSLKALRATLAAKSAEFYDIVKIGRTHLQDATPLTLGQEISGYVAQLDCRATDPRHAAGPAPAGYRRHRRGHGPERASAVQRQGLGRAHATGTAFVSAPNKFQALASHEALLFAHGALKSLAAGLMKIAMTCAGWPAVRVPAWARSAFPRTSRAAPSCRARSIRRSAKP